MTKQSMVRKLFLGAVLLIASAPCVVLGQELPDKAGGAILLWNDQALDTVRSLRLGAFDAARTYAMLNIAMFDAVNGADGSNAKFRKALVKPSSSDRSKDKVAAASAAANAVLSLLFPDKASEYETLLGRIQQRLSQVGVGANRLTRGLNWGASVGEKVFTIRSTDGSTPKDTLVGGNNAGQFRADFGSAAFRNMDSFLIGDPLDYVSSGPPALTSPEYLAAHSEVRLLGDIEYANTEYDEIYSFWKAGGGSVRPPGEWIKIAQVVAEQEGTTNSILTTSVLFAALSIGLGDASISVTFDKFTYQFWRPATAIQNANTDGNDETVQKSTWAPRNGSIGGSPEHTSGQSAFAGCGSTILAEFFGTDNIEFTFEGDNSIAGSRTFASFSDAAREAGRSRIYAGIHFQFSNLAGQATGRGIAREVIQKVEMALI